MFFSVVFGIVSPTIFAHFCTGYESIDEIARFPHDHRQYRGLILANGMEVLLISDPHCEVSAASMAVGVGSKFDLEEVPGLADFAAHVLLKGSCEYKQNFGFTRFVEKHGGTLVAPKTRVDDTIFSFQIDPSHFLIALNKFAHLFFRPLLSYEPKLSLTDALTKVEWAYENRKGDDAYRILEVQKTVGRPNHPYTRYSQACISLLYHHLRHQSDGRSDRALYDMTKAFFNTYYSSNVMKLVVLGQESLDQLEEVVARSVFTKVRNLRVSRGDWLQPYEDHPFGPDVPKYKIYIIPLVVENRLLILKFFIPDYFRKHFLTAYDKYVDHLLTHEGPGSLHSTLVKAGLCISVRFDYESAVGAGQASFTVYLTADGEKHIDDIINLTFQYIEMLSKNGVNEWLFKEMDISYERVFNNSVPGDEPVNLVELVAFEMLNGVTMENVVVKDFQRSKWDASIIKNFIAYLRPDNMNVSVVSQSFAHLANRVEEHYKTQYGLEEISNELRKEWDRPDMALVSELRLPQPNKFIPEKFDLYPLYENQRGKDPYIIYESPSFQIWFKQDDEFRVAQLQMNFQFFGYGSWYTFPAHWVTFFSSTTRFGLKESVLWRVFHQALKLSWSENIHSVEIAEMKWVDWETYLAEDQGLVVTLKGYSDKLPLLVETLFSIMANFEGELDESSFRNTLEKHYLNPTEIDVRENHAIQLLWYARYLREERVWDIESILDISRSLQVSDMRKFLRKVFKRIFVRGFIHGNCTAEGALQMAQTVRELFPSSGGLLPQEILRPRYIETEDGSHYTYRVKNRVKDIYGYSSYFQFNVESTDLDDALGTVLFRILEKSCNLILPEDLKTRVACALEHRGGVRGFSFSAITDNTPDFVNRKVEQYLQTIPDIIRSVSDDEFDSLKHKIAGDYWKARSLFTLADQYWIEIRNQSHKFDRTKEELSDIFFVHRSDVLDFAKKKLDRKSLGKLRISIHVYPTNLTQIQLKQLTNRIKAPRIKDAEAFKSSSTLLNLIPYGHHPIPIPDELPG